MTVRERNGLAAASLPHTVATLAQYCKGFAMALFGYMKDLQRFINDQNQDLVNPGDLIEWINRARREVAMRSQSIRVLPPIAGSVTTIAVTNPGSGYTNPTVTVSGPDFTTGTAVNPLGAQATAVATEVGGQIVNIDVTYGGAGYFQPTVAITDPTGTGATATVQISPILQTQYGQEVYKFSDFPLSGFPGVKEIMAIRSVSIIYANYRYSLPMYSFSTYQAYIRQYPQQYNYVATMCCQFGQGAAGSLYLYPIASQQYQIEVDCVGWPMDLETDQDVEAIPDPWTQAVPFLAAHYCYLSLQNFNAAEYYRKMADSLLPMHRAAASPARRSNVYGRY